LQYFAAGLLLNTISTLYALEGELPSVQLRGKCVINIDSIQICIPDLKLIYEYAA